MEKKKNTVPSLCLALPEWDSLQMRSRRHGQVWTSYNLLLCTVVHMCALPLPLPPPQSFPTPVSHGASWVFASFLFRELRQQETTTVLRLDGGWDETRRKTAYSGTHLDMCA
jgi:hypothetical protein